MKTTLTAIAIYFTMAITAIAAPAPDPKDPQVMSAETLQSYCSSKDKGLRKLCSIYILGVAQGISIGSIQKLKCIRDDLTESEMVNAFMDVSKA